MTKKQTEGWAIEVVVKKDGRSWMRYNYYGSPWKRRTEPAKLMERYKRSDVYDATLMRVHMFYVPDNET